MNRECEQIPDPEVFTGICVASRRGVLGAASWLALSGCQMPVLVGSDVYPAPARQRDPPSDNLVPGNIVYLTAVLTFNTDVSTDVSRMMDLFNIDRPVIRRELEEFLGFGIRAANAKMGARFRPLVIGEVQRSRYAASLNFAAEGIFVESSESADARGELPSLLGLRGYYKWKLDIEGEVSFSAVRKAEIRIQTRMYFDIYWRNNLESSFVKITLDGSMRQRIQSEVALELEATYPNWIGRQFPSIPVELSRRGGAQSP